ncbi:LysM domain protein [Sinorhizobium fredii NGR234]|uniref:LysM domain protein n=1 Tax=Sinorhizobium fredii (strain NBRC 101917 / NGR234) TaxID=394 RepID=C3M995_SINFN|nr:Ig-like domain-containing protein [Sinorhizobium fredii]ACP24661.1 LysM domain protein [Sinorhizobium fredii NGR234]
MIKNKASWVALGVLAIATALMVFVVQPNLDLNEDDKDQAAQPAASGSETAGAAPAGKVEGDSSTGAATQQAAASSAPAAAGGLTIPGFDLLRVEPDGSTVVAGRAQPGTKLEILSGDTVVGTADVNAAGDFAAVFDKPLATGDHQLTLRSVAADGASKISEEVATVSVPKEPGGQLLAMVSKPGEASRLITTPKAESKPTETAAVPATQNGATEATPAPSNIVPGLQVTAVEIEGKKIFVAGNAKPGALVRIYADEKLVGEMKADEQGHFVVDGSVDLAVGSHIIRADMLGEDATKVAMRASVPFDRPAGAQVAAIAGSSAGSAAPGLDGLRTEAGKAVALLKGLFTDGKQPSAEQLAAARSATEFALKSLSEFKPADSSDAAQTAAAAEVSKAAAEALKLLRNSPQDPASIVATLGKVDGVIGPALPQQPAGTVVTASAKPQGTASDAVEPPKPGNTANAAPQSSGEQVAVSPPAEAQPATIEQPPLKQSKESVIIRRGDTLWQISRRVYGAGVRYTTIYLANREQIDNPDLIRPGQVFGVPNESLSDEESREIHRKRVRRE